MIAVQPSCGPPEEWDSVVRASSDWTHFHLYGWKAVMDGALGHDSLYLEARDGSELVGVLPIVRVKSRIFGHFLVSMPFLNYGGPLGTAEAVGALVRHAKGQADAEGGGPAGIAVCD